MVAFPLYPTRKLLGVEPLPAYGVTCPDLDAMCAIVKPRHLSIEGEFPDIPEKTFVERVQVHVPVCAGR